MPCSRVLSRGVTSRYRREVLSAPAACSPGATPNSHSTRVFRLASSLHTVWRRKRAAPPGWCELLVRWESVHSCSLPGVASSWPGRCSTPAQQLVHCIRWCRPPAAVPRHRFLAHREVRPEGSRVKLLLCRAGCRRRQPACPGAVRAARIPHPACRAPDDVFHHGRESPDDHAATRLSRPGPAASSDILFQHCMTGSAT